MSRNESISRRRFLLSAAGHSQQHKRRSNPADKRLHHQHIRQIPPIHPEYWSFTIVGMLGAALILSYEDTLALPSVDVTCTIACNGKGIPRMNTACWRGIPIQTLLDQLNLRASFARFLAADGYVTSLPMESLKDMVLAYQMNTYPLSHEEGFPTRLIVPGYYGYKMPKWVTRMELTDTSPAGFWEARGWSGSGKVQTKAFILSPRCYEAITGIVTLSGNAYAGERNIGRIEVSIDDGPWMPIAFTPARPLCLTEWKIDWSPPAPGDYLIKARAFDDGSPMQNPQTHEVVICILEV